MGDLSRPWDTTVRAADPSLSEMGVAALIAPSTMFKSVGSISERWRFKGLMRATSKPRSASHKEIGPSDLDLLKLSDYQVLCLGTRVVFPEIPVELYAAKDWRVLCARREKRPERIMGLECEAALWIFRAMCRKTNRENVSTKSCQTACHGYAHPPKVGHQSGQSPSVHASCVVSALPPVPVFVIGGSRQSVTQQMRHHADSSGHRNTTRASVGLRARGCPDNVCFWMTPLSTTADHAICLPTRRRERRPCCQRQKPGRSAETRRMEELQQCATLRETCSLVLGYVQDPTRTSPARVGSRTRPGTTLEKDLTRALTGPTLSVGRVFLCIFTTARPVRTVLSGHGYAVLFLDHSR